MYNSIMQNNIWEVVPRPTDMAVVSSRWIYNLKHVADGIVEKFTARFVAKGFSQKEGIDYEDTFALMASYLQEMGFVKSAVDSNLYYLMVVGAPLMLVLHVDSLFFTRSLGLIEDCKRDLVPKFKMKDMGLIHYFLGLEVWQANEEISLSQGRHTMEILKKFGMLDCRSMSTAMITNWKKNDASKQEAMDTTLSRQLIGSLMYLVNTRPNICFAVNTLSQFMVEPKRVH
eukprot:PITA_28095